jgi:hypothetical protein
LSQATETLRDALHDIAKLAKETEKAMLRAPALRLLDGPTTRVWSLALDEICSCGVELAPRLPFSGPRDFTGPERAPPALTKAAPSLSSILNPVKLDSLTVADDNTFLDLMQSQPNVPAAIKTGLGALY